MTECRGCSRHISIDCPYCPHCGKPCGMRSYPAAPKKLSLDRPAVKMALLAAIGLFTIVLWQLFSRVSDASQNPTDQRAAQTTSLSQ